METRAMLAHGLIYLISGRAWRAGLMFGGYVTAVLYVVATPIGNLADMSARAITVLRDADLIAAEDTRHSATLMRHFAIDTPCVAYHEHSSEQGSARIRRCWESGGAVALVSDAGTPLISDPGYRLVREAQELGVQVSPVPGPCAAMAALSVSGLPTDRFFFEGFLSAKTGAREQRLQVLKDQVSTMVFYEAPHRIEDCLAAMCAVFGGEREAVLAREISKTFETIKRDTLTALLQWVSEDANQRRGEIVLVVAGAPAQAEAMDERLAQLMLSLSVAMPPRQAASLLADYSGVRKKLLYQYYLSQQATDSEQ